MEEFAAVFADLEDPRTGNAKRHELLEILLIGLCTVLCGGETCTDMVRFGRAKHTFLEEVLTLRHGIPSHDTFSRVFLLARVSAARSGTVPGMFSDLPAPLCRGLSGRSGLRR